MKIFARVFLLFGLGTLVLACGGSNGGGSTTSTIGGGTGGEISQDIDVRAQFDSSVVAFQDGSGPWTQLTRVPGTSTQFIGHVTDPKGRYAVAFGTRSKLSVFQYTVGETTMVREYPPSKAITGTQSLHMTRPADSTFFFSSAGSSGASVSNSSDEKLRFGNPADLMLGFYKNDYSSGVMKLYRNLPKPSGIAAFSFDESTSGLTTLAPFTISDPKARLYYLTPQNGIEFELIRSAGGTGLTCLSPSKADTPGTDRIFVVSKAGSAPEVTPYWYAEVGTQFASIEDVEALTPSDFPVVPTSIQASAVPGTSKRCKVTFDVPIGLRTIVLLEQNKSQNSYVLSKGWLGTTSAASYTTPDLSSIPDFAQFFTLDVPDFFVVEQFSAASLSKGYLGQMQDRGFDPQVPGFRSGVTAANIQFYVPVTATP